MEHTPTPWYPKHSTNQGLVISQQGGTTVAVVYNNENQDAELLAAAPEMYDAILMLLGCTDLNVDELDETSLEAIRQARTVLQKIEARCERNNERTTHKDDYGPHPSLHFPHSR